MRMLVGWHFLYEGLFKLAQPGGWSAMGYLRTSQWFAAPLFQYIADSPNLLRFCDLLNMWGLTFIGLALLLGVLIRPAAFFGILLLAFYYIAQPPFYSYGTQGHFLLVDRNVIEAVAMMLFIVLPSYGLGEVLEAFFRRLTGHKDKDVSNATGIASPGRRQLLMNLSTLPVVGIFGYLFSRKHGVIWERENLQDKQVDAKTSATVKAFDFSDLKELKKPIDKYGKIGDLELSRMFLGGNLIGGWAHARDLLLY